MKALVATLLILTACFSEGNVPARQDGATVGYVEPLDQLTGVRLGMTARELLEVRPQITVAGYEGYKEEVDGYRIGYVIPGSHNDGQEVPRSNRLVAVSASRSSTDSSAMIQLWSDVAAKFGAMKVFVDSRCVRMEQDRMWGRVIYWEQPIDITLAVFTPKPGSAVRADSSRFQLTVGNGSYQAARTASRVCPEEGVARLQIQRDAATRQFRQPIDTADAMVPSLQSSPPTIQ